MSIERLFADIRKAMPGEIACSVHESPCVSKGVVPRVKNVLAARRNQGQVNHITGDVHFLALGLDPHRTLLTIHDCVSLERLHGLKLAVFRWLWYSWPVRRATVVSVISESTRRELLRHVRCDVAKIRVVPNCVGHEFAPSPKPFNAVEPEVLQLGTRINKNLERLTEALTGMSCQLHVVGPLSEVQRGQLERAKIRYRHTPRATDAELVAAYQRCDLLVFASTYEGFGLPIIEAQATGRPVITSDLLSMPEVAGKGAYLVNPRDVASIRAGISKVCNDAAYRDRLISEGFENVKRFTPRAIAAQYVAIYEEIAARGGNRG